MLCSICKKNVAVIYVNKIVEGKMQTKGLCILCAKKQGLSPMDQLMRQSGMKPEDFENLNSQLTEIIGDMDLEKLSQDMTSENGDGINSLMNFMNNAFTGNTSSTNSEFIPGEDDGFRDFKTERSKRINIDYAEEAKDFLWRYTIQYK